jgi:hypothetical protein
MSESWRDMAIRHIAYYLNYRDKPITTTEAESIADCINKSHYPFGQRRYTPYKVWLEEVRLLRVFLTTGKSLDYYQPWRAQFTSKGERKGRSNSPSLSPPVPGQLTLFEEAE